MYACAMQFGAKFCMKGAKIGQGGNVILRKILHESCKNLPGGATWFGAKVGMKAAKICYRGTKNYCDIGSINLPTWQRSWRSTPTTSKHTTSRLPESRSSAASIPEVGQERFGSQHTDNRAHREDRNPERNWGAYIYARQFLHTLSLSRAKQTHR